MSKDNKPISCYRGIHFTRKVGSVDQCFYCGEVL